MPTKQNLLCFLFRSGLVLNKVLHVFVQILIPILFYLGVSMDEGMEDLTLPSNVSRMRKRFHDLLDDTFSLFGSRKNTPVHNVEPTEVKSHSAISGRYVSINVK